VEHDEQLVEEARQRVTKPLSGRDRWTSVALGGTFVATALALALLLPAHRSFAIVPAVLLIGSYAVVSRVEFEIGPGSAVPTQLVFVPMLFLLPVSVVPLAVAAGYMLGLLVDHVQGKRHGQRAFVLLSYCWHSIGPTVVLSLLAHDDMRWGDAPIYVAALASQFALDFASSTAREKLAFGVSPRALIPFLGWVYAVDALLAPVALAIASVSAETPSASLLALPLVGLLALLARDRTRRIDRALELSEAYRGAMRQARSDPLTALGNRLAWDEALVRAAGETGPVSVILVDLDGLKRANDTRGHEFGDRLLQTMADVVRGSVRTGDVVARIGGDELGVLMLKTDEAGCRAVAARIRRRIGDAVVEGFALSAAVGHASRATAEEVLDAARDADMHMYLEKRAEPPWPFDGDEVLARGWSDRIASMRGGTPRSAHGASADACDVLLAALRERDEGLEQHLRDVADLAIAVAERLGVPAAQLDDVARAAKLHDVGKVAVPDAIVGKDGPLTAEEWEVMRRHPVIGERILGEAPGLADVARLVRASHERYDGRGYPDGLRGHEIPLGARILFVCDAYDAMTSDRPYREPMTHETALAELRANAATQFDPLVVDVFCAVVAERRRAAVRALADERSRGELQVRHAS
jgi:diguanylate cyclase (GGDEF)-like protein